MENGLSRIFHTTKFVNANLPQFEVFRICKIDCSCSEKVFEYIQSVHCYVDHLKYLKRICNKNHIVIG